MRGLGWHRNPCLGICWELRATGRGPQGTLGQGEYLVQAPVYLVHLGLGEESCLLQASAIGLAALHIHFPQLPVVGDGRVELLHDGVHCSHKPATPQLPALVGRTGTINLLPPNLKNSASPKGPPGKLSDGSGSQQAGLFSLDR